MSDVDITLDHEYAYAMRGDEDPFWNPGGGPDVRRLVFLIGGVHDRENYDYVGQNLAIDDSQQTATITTMTPMSVARRSHMVCELAGKIYALCGITTSGAPNYYVQTSSCEEYDPIADAWSYIADAGQPVVDGAVGVINNAAGDKKIVMSAGAIVARSYAPYLRYTAEYDPSTGAWTQKSNKTRHACVGMAYFAVDEELHMVWGGGRWSTAWDVDHRQDFDYYVSANFFNYHDSYSLETDTWQYSVASASGNPHDTLQYHPMTDKRWGAAGFTTDVQGDNYGYVCGGMVRKGGVNKLKKDVQAYSPNDDSWDSKIDMDYYRYGHAATGAGSNAYVLGGAGDEEEERGVNDLLLPIQRFAHDGWSTFGFLAAGQAVCYAGAASSYITEQGEEPKKGYIGAGMAYGWSLDPYGGVETPMSMLQEYNPDQHCWVIRDGFGMLGEPARYGCSGAGASALNKAFLVAGYEVIGGSDVLVTRSALAYEPNSGWSLMRRVPYPPGGMAYSALCYHENSGKVVLVNGETDGSTVITDVLQYDPNTDSWEAKTSYGGRSGARLVDLGDKLMQIGGSGPGGAPTECLYYDPVADAWSDTAVATDNDLGSDMQFHVVMKIDSDPGGIYATAGNVAAANLGNPTPTERFDIGTESWATAAALSPGRYHAGGFGLDSVGVVAGGEHEGTSPAVYDDTQEFDPVAGGWASVTGKLRGPIYRMADFVI